MTGISGVFTYVRNWIHPQPRFWAAPGIRYSDQKYGSLKKFEKHPDFDQLKNEFESAITSLNHFVETSGGDQHTAGYFKTFLAQAFDLQHDDDKAALYSDGIEALREIVVLARNEDISLAVRLTEIEALARDLAAPFSVTQHKSKRIFRCASVLWQIANPHEIRSDEIDQLPSCRRTEYEMKIVKFGSADDFLAFNRHKAEKKWRLDIRTGRMAPHVLSAATKRDDIGMFNAVTDTLFKEHPAPRLIQPALKKKREGLLEMHPQVAQKFSLAMARGDIETMNAIGDKLQMAGSKSIWSPKEIEIVLGRADEKKRSALEMALLTCNAEAVRAFSKILLKLHKNGILENRQVLDLLRFRITPTMLRNAHQETFKAYRDILKDFNAVLHKPRTSKAAGAAAPARRELPNLALRAIHAFQNIIGTLPDDDQINIANVAAKYGTQRDLRLVLSNGLPRELLLKSDGPGANSRRALENIALTAMQNKDKSQGKAEVILDFARERKVPLASDILAALTMWEPASARETHRQPKMLPVADYRSAQFSSTQRTLNRNAGMGGSFSRMTPQQLPQRLDA